MVASRHYGVELRGRIGARRGVGKRCCTAFARPRGMCITVRRFTPALSAVLLRLAPPLDKVFWIYVCALVDAQRATSMPARQSPAREVLVCGLPLRGGLDLQVLRSRECVHAGGVRAFVVRTWCIGAGHLRRGRAGRKGWTQLLGRADLVGSVGAAEQT